MFLSILLRYTFIFPFSWSKIFLTLVFHFLVKCITNPSSLSLSNLITELKGKRIYIFNQILFENKNESLERQMRI